MRCLYFDGKLKLLEDFEKPARGENEALVKVLYASVCNTDKEIIKGYKEGFKGILGHEFVGIVEEAPTKELVGKRVTGEINIGCGVCDFCSRGYPNHCRDRKVLGILHKDGAFAEYLTLPVSNLHMVPDKVRDIEAVFAEPIAAALEITDKNHIRPRDKVAVIGNGKLGQIIAQIVSLTGCDLTVIGRNEKKLDMLKNRAKTLLVKDLNCSGCYDVVIDCTGNQEGIKLAQQIVKAMGKIILKSTYNGEALLNPSLWVVNEITLTGSRCGPMDAALRLLERGLVSTENLVSGVYSLEKYKQAFGDENSLKSIFNMCE